MFFRTKQPGEVLTLEFDFSDFLEREGIPYADYSPLAGAGITVVSTWSSGSRVRVTTAGGTEGGSYVVAVRADGPGGVSETQERLVYVRSAPLAVGPYVPPATDLFYLVDETGALLVTESGAAIYIET